MIEVPDGWAKEKDGIPYCYCRQRPNMGRNRHERRRLAAKGFKDWTNHEMGCPAYGSERNAFRLDGRIAPQRGANES